MDESTVLNLLSIIAGVIILFSSIPQIIALRRDPESGISQSLIRNIMLVVGNAAWCTYGYLLPAPQLGLMCGLAVILNGSICIQIYYARKFNSLDQSTK